MSGSFLFRELLATIAIIVVVVWIWRGMKGVAGNWIPWVVSLITIVVIACFVPMIYSVIADYKSADNHSAAQIQTVKKSECEWYWKLPRGQYLDGRSESAPNERIAEYIPGGPDEICANLHYMEYGNPEVERIRVYRVTGKIWRGYSEQNNPPRRGSIELIESTPGTYSGNIVWYRRGVPIANGMCYLLIK